MSEAVGTSIEQADSPQGKQRVCVCVLVLRL